MTPKEVSGLLASSGYMADESLATLVWMAMSLE
ncbi:MAG: MoxR family ATPase, partial [Oxalobacteraceae bacterium]|nr:MoxR family ATPase [Oxalobacteraceae bacterium]